MRRKPASGSRRILAERVREEGGRRRSQRWPELPVLKESDPQWSLGAPGRRRKERAADWCREVPERFQKRGKKPILTTEVSASSDFSICPQLRKLLPDLKF